MHKISQLGFVGDAASAAGGVVPMHSDASVSAGKAGIAPGGANKLAVGLPSARPASDYLLVGVHHAPRVSLSPTGSTDVPVTLRLRSLCPEPLSVTLAALDHAPSEATTRLMHPGPSYVYNDQPEVTLTKESDHGMRWNGKTQHIGIVLAPNATKDVDVAAYFTKAGVYDLNRFVALLLLHRQYCVRRNICRHDIAPIIQNCLNLTLLCSTFQSQQIQDLGALFQQQQSSTGFETFARPVLDYGDSKYRCWTGGSSIIFR